MNIKERKALLGKFHKDFIVYTLNQISCRAIDRGVAYGGWFEIVFPKALNCEDLVLIGKFIKEKFSQPDRYSHLLPKLTATKEGISLIVQDREVERISNAGKI
jgi:hypothetical protein